MTFVTAAWFAVGVSIAICLLGYVVRSMRIWRQFRGERVVTCPETGHPAAVRIDVAHAALTEIGTCEPDMRLAACSRWPTPGPCDEACLFEAQDPETRVAAIVAHWYAGKTCVYCRQPLGEDHIAGHHAAFLGPDGTTREWSDVAPERLPDALRTAWPVCWNCHVTETFRQRYPQLVTDRTNLTRTS